MSKRLTDEQLCEWVKDLQANRRWDFTNAEIVEFLTGVIALRAERVKLETALTESLALNENFVSVSEPETLSHLSEYKAVIKMARAALAQPAESGVREVTLEPGWLLRDVRKAAARLDPGAKPAESGVTERDLAKNPSWDPESTYDNPTGAETKP